MCFQKVLVFFFLISIDKLSLEKFVGVKNLDF